MHEFHLEHEHMPSRRQVGQHFGWTGGYITSQLKILIEEGEVSLCQKCNGVVRNFAIVGVQSVKDD